MYPPMVVKAAGRISGQFIGFLLSLPLFFCSLNPCITYADAVGDWNAVAATAAVINAKRAPNPANFDITYVQIAIYDAVNAIDGRYTPFAVKLANVSISASREAATAAAAYTVLRTLYPTQQAFLDPIYASALAAIPDGQAKDEGVAIGTEVANQFLALRANDGRDANVPYSFGSGPGVYQLTPGAPPPPATPQAPWLAKVKPFALNSPDQFRPAGPPDLAGLKWAADFNETKDYGASINSLRTPEQTEIGLFYTENPVLQFGRIFRNFAVAQGFSLADSARFFAQLYVTSMDAIIAGWDGKYHFNFWRPVTAIRSGDSDGNVNTVADPDWLPLAVTPNHPEYPAAHGCYTGAYASFLELFFRTKKVHITLSSTVTNTEHTFDNTDDLKKEIIDARIFGGMHYRSSVEDGLVIGKKVAQWVSRNYFRPVRSEDDEEQNDDDL